MSLNPEIGLRESEDAAPSPRLPERGMRPCAGIDIPRALCNFRRIAAEADTGGLEAAGLTRPGSVLIARPDVADCLTRLDRGQVDVVTLAKPVAESEMSRLGSIGHIAEVPALASIRTVHVGASRGRPEAIADLEMVGPGLARFRAPGRGRCAVSRRPRLADRLMEAGGRERSESGYLV